MTQQCTTPCAVARREARLYVCGNGQGSPCLDLRRVPDTLADATVGADLVVVEGMGRAIHTNYRCVADARARPCTGGRTVAPFRCDCMWDALFWYYSLLL